MPQPCKPDPYKEIIRARLAARPELSAARLFEEVKAAGYSGELAQLKLFAQVVRPWPEAEPIVRFETEPGHQEGRFAEARSPRGKRFVLLVGQGSSRMRWLKFYPRADMRVLISGLGHLLRPCSVSEIVHIITRVDEEAGGCDIATVRQGISGGRANSDVTKILAS